MPGNRRKWEQEVYIFTGLAQEEIDNKQVNTKRRYLTGCDHWYQGNKRDNGEYLKIKKVLSEDVIWAKVWKMRMN